MNQQAVKIMSLGDEYKNSLLMVWSQNPTHRQVTSAFDKIEQHLNSHQRDIHIIVDLRVIPSFPLGATFSGALRIQSHYNMGKWLVVGENPSAKFIARMITSTMKKILSGLKPKHLPINDSENYLKNNLLI